MTQMKERKLIKIKSIYTLIPSDPEGLTFLFFLDVVTDRDDNIFFPLRIS